MGFDKFGTVSYTSETRAADFLTYLEQGRVMATRCKKCGTAYFPPQTDCPKCLSSEVEWFEVKGKGKLITYTVANYGPSGFENEIPYTLGIVEFKDGVRILSRLSRDIDGSDIKVGMELKVVPVKLPNDKIAYEFQKAE